jgi:hypothetical protein
MFGMSADLAVQTWMQALSMSRQGYTPARLVKRAVKQTLKTAQPEVKAQAGAQIKQRSRIRQSVRTGFQELLGLLLTNAQRDVVIAKVQEIQRLLDPILAPKKAKR